MLSHDNIVIAARETASLHEWVDTEERIVSYLPLSHIAGMMFDIYYPISKASTTCFADSNALKGTLIENLKYYKPTRFLGVPRVWEKMEEKIKLAGKETKGVKRRLADWAKGEAVNYHLECDKGHDNPSLGYKLAKKLVLSKIHEALGLNHVVNGVCATGGAAIAKDTHLFFLNLGQILNLSDNCQAQVHYQTEQIKSYLKAKDLELTLNTKEISRSKHGGL